MNPEQFLLAEAGRRGETDYRFSWGTYIGWNLLTFGIYSHYATYKLVERRREHAQRRLAFSSYLWHALAARADSLGRRAEVQEGLDHLSRIHAQIESYERKNKRDPALWTILRFVAAPVGAYVNHFLNADFRFLDTWESSFSQNVEWVLQRLGLPAGLPARTRQTPVRSTAVYVLLTIVTLGLFAIWWRYAMMKDGNDHFDEDDAVENAILRGMGIAGHSAAPPPPMAPGMS
ncbi:MAG: DUF4234 domain-containing protein [Actinomycetota bacterium]